MDSEEIAIIKEAQRGSVLAFESLVRKYDRQVLQLACKMVKSPQDAEDIYQEVFIRIYRNLGRFQFRSEFSTWLYRVVINYCINYQRKFKRVRFYSLDQSIDTGPARWSGDMAIDQKDPEESVVNKELSSEIQAALERLPARQKMVFVLRHFQGHKLKEIAAMMECTEGTVKNYLFRATRKMRSLLKQHSSK